MTKSPLIVLNTNHVRNGPNNCNFEGFNVFKDICEKNSVSEQFTAKSWSSSWAQGIIVFDDVMDKEVESSIKVNAPFETSNHHVNDSGLNLEMSYIKGHDHFVVTLPSSLFHQLALHTQDKVTEYLWNPEKSLFYDYNCVLKEQSVYESVTCLWALWSGIASETQAKFMVPRALQLFEVEGGLVSGTENSRGTISLERPNRQWDYPFGWAPHQILAWEGLQK